MERTTRPLHDVTCSIRASCTTVHLTFRLHDSGRETCFVRVASLVGADELLFEKGDDGVLGDLSADADDGGVCSLSNHHQAEPAPVLGKSGKLVRNGCNIFLRASFSFSESRRLGHVAEDHVSLRHRLDQDRFKQRSPDAPHGTYNPTPARGHLRHTR